MRCLTHPTHDSVFGDTYHGVPNPVVPHRHPYPTRYHGAIFSDPQFFLPYRDRPYAQAPFARIAAPLAPWEKRDLRGFDDKLTPGQSVQVRMAMVGAITGAFAGVLAGGPRRRVRGAAIGATASAAAMLIYGAVTA